MSIPENVYQEHGYKSRKDYPQSLSADYGVPKELVFSLSSMMPNEDFDGLINVLEDAGGMFEEE